MYKYSSNKVIERHEIGLFHKNILYSLNSLFNQSLFAHQICRLLKRTNEMYVFNPAFKR